MYSDSVLFFSSNFLESGWLGPSPCQPELVPCSFCPARWRWTACRQQCPSGHLCLVRGSGGLQWAWGQCPPWTPTRLSGWSWTLRAGPYQAHPALPRSRKLSELRASSGSRQHWALSESGRWGYEGTLQRRPPSVPQGCHPFSGRRCCSSHPANHSRWPLV